MFEKSKWIWERENPSPDEYADFMATVTEKNATLFIAAETDYAAYINGKLAFFGSYKGYRDEKYYDELPLNDFLTEKENEIEIVVWYQGINCSSSIDDGAGVIFEISSNGKLLPRVTKIPFHARISAIKTAIKSRSRPSSVILFYSTRRNAAK